jgi:hypothetical protein
MRIVLLLMRIVLLLMRIILLLMRIVLLLMRIILLLMRIILLLMRIVLLLMRIILFLMCITLLLMCMGCRSTHMAWPQVRTSGHAMRIARAYILYAQCAWHNIRPSTGSPVQVFGLALLLSGTFHQTVRCMWLHGVGWLLPMAVEVAMLYVVRNGLRHDASFLQPCKEAPLSLHPERCFRHLLFSQPPAPMAGPASARAIAHRHHPPSGLQLWPGHSLHLHLRLPWSGAYRPAAAHWPRDWSAHLRTWHMIACPVQRFKWHASPWHLACPVVFTPVQVHYHAVSGHAEWTFELKER